MQQFVNFILILEIWPYLFYWLILILILKIIWMYNYLSYPLNYYYFLISPSPVSTPTAENAVAPNIPGIFSFRPDYADRIRSTQLQLLINTSFMKRKVPDVILLYKVCVLLHIWSLSVRGRCIRVNFVRNLSSRPFCESFLKDWSWWQHFTIPKVSLEKVFASGIVTSVNIAAVLRFI